MTNAYSHRDWQLMSLGGNWDGGPAVLPDVNADAALSEGLWLMQSLLKRKDSLVRVTPLRGRHATIEEFAKRLNSLLGMSMEAVFGQLERNTLHPHLEVLLLHFWQHEFGKVARKGNLKTVIEQLEVVRAKALSDEVQQRVKGFEELSRRRLLKNRRLTSEVLRNRRWMTALWVQLGIPRYWPAPPDTDALLLRAALGELTKTSAQWRTRITFNLDMGHREVMGGYYADLVVFFDVNEGRSGVELAEMVRSEWGDITCGAGRMRHVTTIARRYFDQAAANGSAGPILPAELKVQVASLLAMFADRSRFIRLTGIGCTHRSAPVKVLSHVEQGPGSARQPPCLGRSYLLKRGPEPLLDLGRFDDQPGFDV